MRAAERALAVGADHDHGRVELVADLHQGLGRLRVDQPDAGGDPGRLDLLERVRGRGTSHLDQRVHGGT